jgi:hypothetical protein
MARRVIAAFTLVLLSVLSVTAEGDGPPRRQTFGLIGVALRADLTVYQGGARDAEGAQVIREGDRLLTFNGAALADLDAFCRALYATTPGRTATIELERRDEDGKAARHTVVVLLGDRRVAFADLYRHAQRHATRETPGWLNWRPPQDELRSRVRGLLDEHDLADAWNALMAAHARELDLWDCFERRTALNQLLLDPPASHQFLLHVGDAFAAAVEADCPAAAVHDICARLMDSKPAQPPVLDQPDFMLRALMALDRTHDGAQPVTTRDLDHSKVREFELVWRGQPGHEKCVEVVHYLRTLEMDPVQVLAIVGEVVREITGKLKEQFDNYDWNTPRAPGPREPVRGGRVFLGHEGSGPNAENARLTWNTPWGLVAVGGYGRNVWQCTDEEHYAVIVDLGGNDEYIDCAVTRPGRPVSLVVDLAGNDRYRSTGKWGVAAGVLGTAVIWDVSGDDDYECADWGIGAAFGGIGLIVDMAGNDRYIGGDYTIGAAAYGVGGVIDLGGDDLYSAHGFSIGCGLPGGLGFVLDGSGDDTYRCGGRHPSGYGTPGEYLAFGIGCGFGWRGLAGGGIGIVVDADGHDVYDAGEFGLGCGYFLGLGMVRDLGGNDVYRSSRYGLAAAAHCAVGLFMDDAGNDTYTGKTAASMAGVWDIATGYFHDGGGDDVYRADGLALGASSQNGVGIFWDAGGRNAFRAGGRSMGSTGTAEYAGGRLARNFGIFLATGGGENSYPPGERGNGRRLLEREHGIFLDD